MGNYPTFPRPLQYPAVDGRLPQGILVPESWWHRLVGAITSTGKSKPKHKINMKWLYYETSYG